MYRTNNGALFSCVLLILFVVFNPFDSAVAQDRPALQGFVKDAETGDPLQAASIQILETGQATTTNPQGRFTLSGITMDTITLRIRFLGYHALEKKVDLDDRETSQSLEFELTPAGVILDDIVYTATPTGSRTVYQPTHSFSPVEMQRRSSASFGEMLDGEPGIAMRSFGPAPSRPVIRGFDGDRILMLENGNRMGDLSNTAHDHNISLDPLAAKRIEVVRGPASLLYGSSAIGGVVNLITADMPRDWTAGSSGSIALDGATMNKGLGTNARYRYGEESWAATKRISYRGADDMKTPQGKLPGTSINNMEAAGGFGYRSDRLDAGLTLTAVDHRFGLPEELDDPDEEAEIRMDQQTLQGRANRTTDGFFQDIELRAHASRIFQQEVEMEQESNGSIDEDIELEFLQRGLNATLTLHHRPLGLLDDGAVGLNLNTSNMEVGGEEVFTPGADDRSMALFTFNELPVSQQVRLQFGMRGEVRSLSTRSNHAFSDLDDRRTANAFSGSVGLNVKSWPGLELGAQLSRSHRFPILEEYYAEGVHFGAGVYEEGDVNLDTEVGHGADLFALWVYSRLRAEISGFYYLMNNYVAFEPTGETYTDDAGRDWDHFRYRARNAEMMGGEAQISLLITEAWSLEGVADYVRGTSVDTGEPLPTIPPLRVRLESRYDAGNWWAGGQIRMVDEQKRVAEHELATGGYTLTGLEGGYRFDAAGIHRISMRVDNLTNTLYRDHLSRIDRTEFGSPMPGRNINLSYRYNF